MPTSSRCTRPQRTRVTCTRCVCLPLRCSTSLAIDLGVAVRQIDTNVFLGDFNAAANRGNLRELGITHVVTVIIGVPPMFGDDFTYKIVPIRDSPECNIHQYLTECCEFIQDALMQNGRVKVRCDAMFCYCFPILTCAASVCQIHCMKGVSRSATVAAAWLMWNHNWLVDAAISHLQSVRPVVNPNTGFRKQLEDWRAEFVAQRRERQGPSKPLSVEGLAIVSEGGGTALAAGLAMERGSALETRDVVVL